MRDVSQAVVPLLLDDLCQLLRRFHVVGPDGRLAREGVQKFSRVIDYELNEVLVDLAVKKSIELARVEGTTADHPVWVWLTFPHRLENHFSSC